MWVDGVIHNVHTKLLSRSRYSSLASGRDEGQLPMPVMGCFTYSISHNCQMTLSWKNALWPEYNEKALPRTVSFPTEGEMVQWT